MELTVLSRGDLVKMKRESGRSQDLEDARARGEAGRVTHPTHRFTAGELERGRSLSPSEVLRIIEGWRALHQPRVMHRSTLISLKVQDPVLRAFKDKASLTGVPYQSQIKALMRQWLGQNPYRLWSIGPTVLSHGRPKIRGTLNLRFRPALKFLSFLGGNRPAQAEQKPAQGEDQRPALRREAMVVAQKEPVLEDDDLQAVPRLEPRPRSDGRRSVHAVALQAHGFRCLPAFRRQLGDAGDDSR